MQHTTHPQQFVLNGKQEFWYEDASIQPPQHTQVQVAMRAFGICGSDLEYYKYGICNVFQIESPLVLIHEACADVLAIGNAVQNISVGDKVAVNPMRSCGTCTFCVSGKQRYCHNLFFHGSASKTPHMQGFAKQLVTVEASQCFVLPQHIPYSIGVLCEPLSVCLHAVRYLPEKKAEIVVIFGGGTIGQLLIIALKNCGFKNIYMCDIADFPLQQAQKSGAIGTFNLMSKSGKTAWGNFKKNNTIPFIIEASGSVHALTNAIESIAFCGHLIQVGTLHGDISKHTAQKIMNKEICYKGSMRFDVEFAMATDIISVTSVQTLEHLVTHQYHFDQAPKAFEIALDSSVFSTKVIFTSDY